MLVVIPLLTTACSDGAAPPDAPVALPAKTAPDDHPADRWLGTWRGPEGSSLRLSGGAGRYDITVQDLDGPRGFRGVEADEGIRFERNGRQVVIRASDGAGTGMKWLGDKSDCLTLQPGEGYCRDRRPVRQACLRPA
jgi:hypothetical protein